MKQINETALSMEIDAELEKLCSNSVELIHYARSLASRQINMIQIMTYYSLGKWIVEVQQKGEKRAKYGRQVIKKLSDNLQKEFGKGFSEDTLSNMRKFYLIYKNRISETLFRKFQTVDKAALESALQRHFSLYLNVFLKCSKKMRYTGFQQPFSLFHFS